MDSEKTKPNQDPKEHIIMALARAKQSTYLLKTLMLSTSLTDPLMFHIYDIQYRALYVDLYILFDKQKNHLSIKTILETNKNKLKNSDYEDLMAKFHAIEEKYSKVIATIVSIGNSIIRHLDPKAISNIYGEDYSNENNAFEITEVKSMLDEVITLLKDSAIFKEVLFEHFDIIVEYAQIIRKLNLDIESNRLGLLR